MVLLKSSRCLILDDLKIYKPFVTEVTTVEIKEAGKSGALKTPLCNLRKSFAFVL